MADPPSPPTKPRPGTGSVNNFVPRVGIVGGGLAGLAAAQAIRAAAPELPITLFESRRQTGGRAGSFIDPQSREEVDYCQHVAMGCCTNLLAMLDDSGLADVWERYQELTFHSPGSPPSRFAPSRWLPPPLHLLPSLGRLNHLTARQRAEIRRGTWLLMRQSSRSLGQLTASQWLAQSGQSPETIRDYWDVVLVSALGETTAAVSMTPARKVFVDGFLASRGACDVLVPRLSLGELFGHRLPETLRAAGVELRTQSAVRRIAVSESATTPSAGRLCIELANERWECDQLIVAVPWHQVGKLVDPTLAVRAGIEPETWAAFPSSPISGVHLWFDRPLTDAPHAVLVGTLAQWLFRRRMSPEMNCSPHQGSYHQVVISAARPVRQLSSDQVIRQVVEELKATFPRTADAQLLAARVVTDPQAVFSVSPAVEATRPKTTTRHPSLHLAGDFVQTGWPSTMEGAVISGRQAAHSLLRALGRPGNCLTRGLRPSLLARLLVRA